MKQRLVGGLPAAQRIEANALLGEVNFAADQAMSPARADFKGLTEQIGSAAFVGAAQEDHRAFELTFR